MAGVKEDTNDAQRHKTTTEIQTVTVKTLVTTTKRQKESKTDSKQPHGGLKQP